MKVTADQLPVYKAVVVVLIVALQSPQISHRIKMLKAKQVSQMEGKKVAE
jgi:simple sugar transport system permease protein